MNLTAFSQDSWEIKLSTHIPQTRMGKWTVGDYTVFVSLDTISVMLRKGQENMINAIAHYGDRDSNLVNYYKATEKRYGIAATQLEHAKNDFDLQSIIIYEGQEDIRQNKGDSRYLKNLVDQFVQKGNAIVYFKGKRIFTLCRSSESTNQGSGMETASEILNSGYEIRTFYDDPGNFLFFEYYHLGW